MITFQELFQSYRKSHGVYRLTGKKDHRGKAQGQAYTVEGVPTERDWSMHFAGGRQGLGLIPLLDDNENVMWGAIDIDEYPLDHTKLEKDLRHLPLTITLSKSGGAHLWLFLKEPTNAEIIISSLRDWASAAGWGHAEVFPKQHHRVMDKDVGNWINLPYFGASRVMFYEGELHPDRNKFVEVAEARRTTLRVIQNLNKKIVSDEAAAMFADGPPCFQTITSQGCPEGGRNKFLFNVAVYYRRKDETTFREKTRRYNKDYIPDPLPGHEVEGLLDNVANKNYSYGCSDVPICKFCNKAECKRREFGVAFGQIGADALNIVIDGLTKINTTKPRWLVNIDGVRAELDGTADLLNQAKFNILCVEKVNKMMVQLKPHQWKKIVDELLEKCEVVEADPLANPEGQFEAHLAEFVLSRETDIRDGVAQGNVFVQDGKAYFQANELFQYLRREGFRDLKTSQMFRLLHDKGLSKGRWNVKGRTVAWWCVPIEKLQDEPYDTPQFEDAFGDKKNVDTNEQN